MFTLPIPLVLLCKDLKENAGSILKWKFHGKWFEQCLIYGKFLFNDSEDKNPDKKSDIMVFFNLWTPKNVKL